MEIVSLIVSSFLTIALFVLSIYVTRNFKKADSTDKELDTLRTDQAGYRQKQTDISERTCKVETQVETIDKKVSDNFVIQSQSLHAAITRAGDTYARRDDMDKVLAKIDAMPDKMESRFRGILADRDAHKQ